MNMLESLTVVAVLLLATPLAARAQTGVIGGGAALPIGPNADAPAAGFQLNGGLEFGPAASPVAFRLEALYDRLPFRYTPVLPCPLPGCSPQSAHESLLAATFDVVLRPSAPTTPFVPYLIAGAGLYDYYNSKYDGSHAAGFGVNAGLGLRLPVLHAFVEARAHLIRNAPNCLPITFGLRF